MARVSICSLRRIMYSSRRNSRGSRSIKRSARLAVRSMRSSSSGPTRSTVSRVSAGRRNSASSRGGLDPELINHLRRLPFPEEEKTHLDEIYPKIVELEDDEYTGDKQAATEDSEGG